MRARARLIASPLATFSLILMLTLPLRGSVQTHSLAGEVIDEKGRAIAGAVCTLTSPRPGLLPEEGISITTNDKGQFEFPGLFPGSYTLYCSAVTHEPIAKPDIEVSETQGPPFVQMVLPDEQVVHQQIEVREKSAVISAQSSAPPSSLGSHQLQTLPLIQQKFKAALPLVPGVIR